MKFDFLTVDPYTGLRALFAVNPAMDDAPLLPTCRNGKAAAGAKTEEFTILPRGRERGEQVDDPIVAGEKHFGDPRRTPEVPVDLEGRMVVKHIF